MAIGDPQAPGPSPMEKFIAAINNKGVQHSNKFEIRIETGLWGVAFEEDMVLRCESVSLPGRNLNSITDSNFFGPTREIVDGVTYAEDVTCTFVADGMFDIRRFFEAWQERAFNTTTWEVRYHEDYVGKVHIWLLSNNGIQTFGLTLHEAFPKTISANELNMNSANELQKISVGFSFRYWEPSGGGRPSLGRGQQTIIHNPNKEFVDEGF